MQALRVINYTGVAIVILQGTFLLQIVYGSNSLFFGKP